MERYCSVCGARLTAYNPGRLCFPCQKERIDPGNNGKLFYDVHDMMNILGLSSEEQVRRMGRNGLIPGRIPGIKIHHYLKTVVDEWIGSRGKTLKKPASPAQEEAYKRCKEGDHSWFADNRFDGIAFQCETVNELTGHIVNIRCRRTCYFCGHVEVGFL